MNVFLMCLVANSSVSLQFLEQVILLFSISVPDFWFVLSHTQRASSGSYSGILLVSSSWLYNPTRTVAS
jgi:hypothetical protein